MNIDRFDILAIAAAAVLTAGAVVLGLSGGGETAYARPAAARVKPAPDPAMYPKLDAARTLLEAGQAQKALETLGGLSKEYPAEAEVHALSGQAHARLLSYPRAMASYRTTLLMDPDYVDKKSKKFIGKRIKAAVKEGMAEAKAALAGDTGDKAARAALKDAYYLERMLAGGCE